MCFDHVEQVEVGHHIHWGFGEMMVLSCLLEAVSVTPGTLERGWGV